MVWGRGQRKKLSCEGELRNGSLQVLLLFVRLALQNEAVNGKGLSSNGLKEAESRHHPGNQRETIRGSQSDRFSTIQQQFKFRFNNGSEFFFLPESIAESGLTLTPPVQLWA